MKVWIDAQLPPALANWLTDNFDVQAIALRDLELRDAQDTGLRRLRFRASLVNVFNRQVQRGLGMLNSQLDRPHSPWRNQNALLLEWVGNSHVSIVRVARWQNSPPASSMWASPRFLRQG